MVQGSRGGRNMEGDKTDFRDVDKKDKRFESQRTSKRDRNCNRKKKLKKNESVFRLIYKSHIHTHTHKP